MKINSIISLGAACAPAWQIRTYTGRQEAFPFDWTVLPFRSLISLLDHDFENFMADQAFAVTEDGRAIMNVNYPTLHLHDFLMDSAASDHWRAQIPAVRSKYEHLIQRWRAVMTAGGRILLVRQQGHFETCKFTPSADLTPTEADHLCRQIEGLYPHADFTLLYVDALRGKPTHPRARASCAGWDSAEDWPDPDDRWRGPTRRWQAMLREYAEVV